VVEAVMVAKPHEQIERPRAMPLLEDLSAEVWRRIEIGAAAAGAAATVMFFYLKADAASGMQSAISTNLR
jgi:hypothetical protein